MPEELPWLQLIIEHTLPEFGIATTVAHQERFGQFADDKKLLGATDAAANKILFQLGGKDAEEQALEFAAKPPTETRRALLHDIIRNGVFLIPLGGALLAGWWYAALATVVVFGVNLMMS